MADSKKTKAAAQPINTQKKATLDRLKSVVEYHRTHGNADELKAAEKALADAQSED